MLIAISPAKFLRDQCGVAIQLLWDSLGSTKTCQGTCND